MRQTMRTRCKIIEVDKGDAYYPCFGEALKGQIGDFEPSFERELDFSNLLSGNFYSDLPVLHGNIEYTDFFFAAVFLEPIPLNGTTPKEVEDNEGRD